MIFRRRPRRQNSGLTLLELMVSSLLAAILMVTLLSLMRVIWAENARSDAAVREPSAQRLGELLRRDMLHARQIKIQPNTVSLAGFLAHDRRTRAPTLRPAVVTYRVVGDASGRLLREERHLDEVPPTSFVDVVWAGVRRIEITAFDDSRQPGMAERASSPPIPGMSSMPFQLLVVVRGADGNDLCREEILHHAQY